MQTIYIDISNKGMIQPVYAKQGDIGRKFVAVFMENGGRYNIPIGSMFSAWYKGSSGEGNYTDVGEKSAFSIANNRVTVELITEMLSVPGEGFICLVLSQANGVQIGSWNIPYICEEVPGFGSEEATEYFTAFSKALEDIRSNPENIEIDKSLSIDGAAADAAAVSYKLQEHENLIADNAVEIAMLKEKVESGGITDEEFAAKVEEKVVFELQSGSGELFDNVQRISANISDESLYNAGLVENDEDGNPIYFPDRRDNPNQVTAEQVGAVAEEQLAEKMADAISKEFESGGFLIDTLDVIAGSAGAAASEEYLEQSGFVVRDEDGTPVRNVPTYKELEEAVAESEAVIVTNSGATTSHSSQEIYALAESKKVVYLFLDGYNYIRCTSSTEAEAKFEDSYLNAIEAEDGKSYNSQKFRLFSIKNNTLSRKQADIPSADYINAQIQHYLNL